MHRIGFAAVFSVFTLSACGGGGDMGAGVDRGTVEEDLFVKANYPTQSASLFGTARIVPVLEGFKDYAPNCSLAGGTIPEGMTLNRDCSITGRATKEGTFGFTVNVGADNAKNTIQALGTIHVNPPALSYPFSTRAIIGSEASFMPRVANWNVSSADQSSWSYALIKGMPPPGMTFNPATGAVSGKPTTKGSYELFVQGTVTTPYGTAKTGNGGFVNITVEDPPPPPVDFAERLSYGAVPLGGFVPHINAFVAQPMSSLPAKPAAGQFVEFKLVDKALPAGLTLNSETGEISGTPTQGVGLEVSVAAYLLLDGVKYPTRGLVMISIYEPIAVEYGFDDKAYSIGKPLSIAPTFVQKASIPVTDATYSFSPQATCQLPAGVTLDASTGVISGTPTAATPYNYCYVDVTIATNNISWTQWHLIKLQLIDTPVEN